MQKQPTSKNVPSAGCSGHVPPTMIPREEGSGPAFEVESFIQECYGAWGGTDEDRILAYYSDDVVLQIPGTLMEGKEALRDQFVRPFVAAFPGNHHLVKSMILGPGVVAVEFTFEAQ